MYRNLAKLSLALVVAVALLALGITPAFAQGGPPPGGSGGGGGGLTTLSDLGCGPDEIARVNAADEWECSPDLTANEAAAAAAQTTADQAVSNAATAQSTADTAVSNAATAQSTADQAVSAAAAAQSTADGAVSDAVAAQSTADTAVSNAATAQSTADDALNTALSARSLASTALGKAATAQSTADGAQAIGNDALAIGSDAQNRVAILEGQNLDGRVTNLEASSGQLIRTVVVSPVGPNASVNGNELLAAVQDASNAVPPPSSENPYQVVVEPGTFDIGNTSILLPPFVSLFGSGQNMTIIRGSSLQPGNIDQFVIEARTSSEVRNLKVVYEIDGALSGRPGGIKVDSFSNNVHIQDVTIEGNANGSAIFNRGATVVQITNATIRDVLLGIQSVGTGSWSVVGLKSSNAPTGIQANVGLSITVRGSDIDGSIISTGQGTNIIKVSASVIGAVNEAGGTIEIANSQILGTVSGTPTCAFSYDVDLLPLDAACQ